MTTKIVETSNGKKLPVWETARIVFQRAEDQRKAISEIPLKELTK